MAKKKTSIAIFNLFRNKRLGKGATRPRNKMSGFCHIQCVYGALLNVSGYCMEENKCWPIFLKLCLHGEKAHHSFKKTCFNNITNF